MMKKLILVTCLVACGGGGGGKAGPAGGGGLATGPDPAPAGGAQPAAAQPAPPKAKGNPRSDLIPRSVLFGNPERALVRISPDGKWLSWVAPAKDGVLNVWVAPIGKLDQATQVTSDTVRPITQYVWAFTSKHILYLQDTAGDENYHVFRVDLADRKTTDLTPFAGARASIDARDPRQPTKVVVSVNNRNPQAFDLHQVDLISGKTELLVQNDDGFIGFTFDHALRPRFAVKKLPDGATQISARAANAKDPRGGWTVFDTIPFEDADSMSIVGFTPRGNSVYAIEPRGRDTAAFVEIDLATKQGKVLAEDARADAGGAIIHPTKHNVQAVVFEYDRRRWKVLDRSIQGDLDALAKLDGGEVYIDSRTLDDKTWIVQTSSEQHPGNYYVWNRGTRKASFLFAVQPELDKQPLVKMWPVEIKSRDGLTLVSYLSLPAAADPDGDGKPNAPGPMVLYVHGGPWARDSWSYEPLHQMFANRGYAVLSVNYRGSTGFGKKFFNAANLQWGKAMHDDLIDAVEWAIKSGVALRDKVGIVGGSYGGYATLAGLTLTPDVFACGVDLVGVSSILTFIESIPPYWAPFMGFIHARVGNPDTPEGKAALLAASPLTHASKIKRPLLIGQGANDPRVKQAESEQIVAAMKKHGLPVTYALFPDEGHGFAQPVNNIAFFAIAEAFLSAHLGGHYLPITPEEIKASSMQIKDGKDGIPGLP